MKKSGARKKQAPVKKIIKAKVAAQGVTVMKHNDGGVIMDFGGPAHYIHLPDELAVIVAGELNRKAGFSPVVQFRKLVDAWKKVNPDSDLEVNSFMNWITDPMNLPKPELVEVDKTVKELTKDKSPMGKVLGIGKSGDDVDVSGMSASDILARLTNKGDA